MTEIKKESFYYHTVMKSKDKYMMFAELPTLPDSAESSL